MDDFEAIYSIAKKNSELLGPINPIEIRIGIVDKRVIISYTTDIPVKGFCLFTILKRRPELTVNQICVSSEYRSEKLASCMLQYLKQKYGRDIKTTCIKDSSAEAFWSRVATKYAESPGKKRELSKYIIKVKGGKLF